MRYDPKSFESPQPAGDGALERASLQPIPAPAELLHRPGAPRYAAPAAPDVPAALGGLIAASYVTLLGALAVATTGSPVSIFAIAIAAFFVAIFFAVPRIFFGVEPRPGRRPTLDRFIRDGMDTLTGHSSGPAAMVQMLVVPVSLTLGVLAMGMIVAIYF